MPDTAKSSKPDLIVIRSVHRLMRLLTAKGTNMKANGQIGLGLIGCGAFGKFCLEAYSQMENVRIAAVADVVAPAADEFGRRLDVPAFHDPHELIACADVDLVHIATPPSSHFELVVAATRAGKHCLCEKPLAMSTIEADEMLSLAEDNHLILPVNFVLRYNAVTETVKAVLDSGVLGEVLSARLTNCAGDTKLGPKHWFWDKSVSGGIFIEHGVHFFDLYRYWFGPGEVVSAHAELRPGTLQEDRVTCEIHHDEGIIASHYHGFDQMSLMDRTDHRFVCEKGDIRVFGWIPLTMEIDAVVDEMDEDKLRELAPGCHVTVTEKFDGETGRVMGRGRKRRVTMRISLSYTPDADKQAVYADSVEKLLADQVAYLLDDSHQRRVTEQNGRDAVALAETAANIAETAVGVRH